MIKYLLILLLIITSNYFCHVILQVPPQQTDSTIDDWLTPHLVYLTETDSIKPELFLYIPGSNENPKDAQFILKLAAENGYNAISLSYPNDLSENIACSQSADSLCFENLRMEIIYGVDLTDEVNVNMPNSLNNRLISLLLYLRKMYPEGKWDRYLTEDENINWIMIIVAGHALGGGHAAMIAKYNSVARLIMFASPPDFSEYFEEPAFWLSDSFATQVSLIYAFAHQQDGLNRTTRIWHTMNLDEFGGTIDVDYNPFPYENTHILTTNIIPAPTGSYNSSLIVDKATPKDSSGEPLLKQVWQYLCFYHQPVSVEKDITKEKRFLLYANYPNPFNPSTTIKYYVPNYVHVRVEIFNLLGEKVITLIDEYKPPGFSNITWNGKNSSGEDIASGVYLYKMTAGNFTEIKKMLMIK